MYIVRYTSTYVISAIRLPRLTRSHIPDLGTFYPNREASLFRFRYSHARLPSIFF